MTAVEAREHIAALEAERAEAIAADLIGIDAYRYDLDELDPRHTNDWR